MVVLSEEVGNSGSNLIDYCTSFYSNEDNPEIKFVSSVLLKIDENDSNWYMKFTLTNIINDLKKLNMNSIIELDESSTDKIENIRIKKNLVPKEILLIQNIVFLMNSKTDKFYTFNVNEDKDLYKILSTDSKITYNEILKHEKLLIEMFENFIKSIK